MPRYSTASGSEDSDFPSLLPPSPSLHQLNSTPRFQLPFNNNNNNSNQPSDEENNEDDEDGEGEEAWDEVDIPNQPEGDLNQSSSNQSQDNSQAKGIEIVISKGGKSAKDAKDEKKKSNALTAAERQLRQERHKVHAMTLLAMGLVRNRYLNDKELQARLISHLPSQLHISLLSITREKYPNPRDRSRLFEAFLKDLVSWWYQAFTILPGKELKRKGIQEVEEELKGWKEELERLRRKEKKGKGKEKSVDQDQVTDLPNSKYKDYPWEEETLSYEKRKKRLNLQQKQKEPIASTSTSPSSYVRPYESSPTTWEPLASINSLYAAAASLKGSKDLSSQLFVALLRGLDVPARLVVSLQGMEWRSDSAAGLTKKESKSAVKGGKGGRGRGRGRGGSSAVKGKGKGKQVETIELSSSESEKEEEEEDDGDGKWQDGRGKLNYKVPKPNLRRSGSSQQQKMAAWKKEKMMMRSPSPDAEDLLSPPTQWPEAYSRYLKEWVTLDPTRKLVRCKAKMEPVGKAKGTGNALVYVVGFEEDGSAHDVTPRYAKSYNIATVKLRVPTSSKAKKDNGGKDWFGTVIKPWERKFQLNRDKVEEEELWNRTRNEPFPTSFGGFKNHPNFVLEQHLHRDEALVTGTKPLGLFKATTPVFPRSAVLVVKSTENWYRIGRSVKDGEIPRKFVKGRAVTINSKRREEFLKLDGGEVHDQPLFSEDQTEVYVPDPVVDGKVPKNSFGNIDLFVPSMLPEGAVHLPSKLAAKCAKMLQVDYAEAIIGFEFRQRRATPTMSGIVVAVEIAETLRQAIANLEQQTLEKTLAQQQDRVLKRWKKLITGLRIRQRLKGQFKDVESGIIGEAANQTASAGGSASGSATGTPRRDASASSSPAPLAKAAEKKARATSSSARKRPSRRSPSSSAHSSVSPDPEEDYEDRPPPRKRTTRASKATRSTRSSTVADSPPATDRSLRIRLTVPKSSSQSANTDTPLQGEGVGTRRSTRASAIKAKQNFAPAEEEEEEERHGEDETGVDEDDDKKAEHTQEERIGLGGEINGHESDNLEVSTASTAQASPNDAPESISAKAAGAGSAESGEVASLNGAGVEGIGGDEGDDEYGFEYESE